MPDRADAQRVAPIQARDRVAVVDILRGVALLWILIENMSGFSGRPYNWPSASGLVDRALLVLILFFLQAKSYSLLSFLFGWGMAVQMDRVEAHGGRVTRLYARRLLALLVLGVLHGTLIWSGDVLTLYAFVALLVLLVRKWAPRSILVAAICSFLLVMVVYLPGMPMEAFRRWYDQATSFLRVARSVGDAYAGGTFKAITLIRIHDYLAQNSWLVYYLGSVLGMFLLGHYAGKREFLRDLGRNRPFVRAVMWVGLAIGALSNAGYTWMATASRAPVGQGVRFAQVALRTVGAPAMVLFYVAAATELSRSSSWRHRLAPLASVGRMSLSNYLLQSIVCTLTFYGYGLGLYGQVGITAGVILAGVLYWVQVQISEWWLDRYQYGPVEWVWRMVTYGRWLPLGIGASEAGRTPAWWQWARARLGRLDRRIVLSGAVIVSLAALVVLWRVRSPTASTSPEVAGQAEPIVISLVPTPQQVYVVATPAVASVRREPGPFVRAGDVGALALALDPQAILAQVEALTGPPFLGRYPSTEGGTAAGDYIARQFAAYGLQPAGDERTFFQSFPIEYAALADVPSLVVRGAEGTVEGSYVLNRDYSTILRWYAGAGNAVGQAVWMNNCTRDDFGILEVVDRVVLCREGDIQEAQRNALEHGAAGLLLMAWPERRPPDFGMTRFEPWVPRPLPTMRVYPSVVQGLLAGSGKSLEDLTIQYEPFLLQTSVEVRVETVGAEACPGHTCYGRNVLGVLPGSDPAYADQVVVIGAHYDHLGQTPDGTAWVGANDDASGVAVLLELARAWFEQGYVPRRTVLFAAWDAEELGLLGSRYYVAYPRYPLESTIADLQLDMVGAGQGVLCIDGQNDLGQRLLTTAEALGIQAEITADGGSDHVPFLMAGVPASMLIWSFGSDEMPTYHRPVDTVDTLDPTKVEQVARLVGTSVLALVEGEPGIADLLAERGAAILAGDLEAFLATSAEADGERVWFAGVQALAPTEFDLQADAIQIAGNEATARVRINLAYPDEEGNRVMHWFSQDVRFVRQADGWKWAGPALVPIEQEGSLAVWGPPDEKETLTGVADLAAGRAAEIAELLGLPPSLDADLMWYPNLNSLAANHPPSWSTEQDVYVSDHLAEAVYDSKSDKDALLTQVVTQLLLARAGVSETAVPWLWHGLPLAIQAHLDATGTDYLDALQEALSDPAPVEKGIRAWAAVEYLRRRIGWQGIGQLALDLGAACRQGACQGSEGGDAALQRAMGQDQASFQATWPSYWQEQLAAIQRSVDALLATRTQAILAGDRDAFLSTVDARVPGLVGEQQNWFSSLDGHSIEAFSLLGRPLALLEDNSLLCRITMQYQFAEAADPGGQGRISWTALLRADRGGYVWAGVPMELLQDGMVSIFYPTGYAGLAADLLANASGLYGDLAGKLGIEQPEAVRIKLYDDRDAFRGSVSLAFPMLDQVSAYTARAGAVKLVVGGADTAAELYQIPLAQQLLRYLLLQAGVESEWFMQSISARVLDGLPHNEDYVPSAHLDDLLDRQAQGDLYSLRDLPPAYLLSAAERQIVESQVWDSSRYLIDVYGDRGMGGDVFMDLLQQMRDGNSLDAALERTVGLDLTQFEESWLESLARGHIKPSWVEVAQAFDPEQADAHVQYLASEELAGRQAGSQGAEAAAGYITAKFAEYGLMPVYGAGEVDPFLQRVPISYTVLAAAPRLEVVDAGDRIVESFRYREDFVLASPARLNRGDAVGELVYVRDDTYDGMRLGGKVVLRHPSLPIEDEVARAIEHGASGLVLIGDRASSKTALAKTVLPATFPQGESIPVIELTKQGYAGLLNAAGTTPETIAQSPPALPLGLAIHIEVMMEIPRTVETANVLGMVPGSDPQMAQEVVIVGAHYDHVGDDPVEWRCDPGTLIVADPATQGCQQVEGRRYPGANDDASGVGVLLEIARLWQETGYRPRHSVLFVAWGAQEPGELGATYFISHPVLALGRTVAVMQLDAVGGGEGYYLEAQGDLEQEGLLRFNMEMAEPWVDGRLVLSRSQQESDQLPFHQAGLPALLLTWHQASEENLPVEEADPVLPYRLGVTGRMVTLALMMLAR